MTAEEAIKHLKLIIGIDVYADYFQEVCVLAKEALEKQIPKKPHIFNYAYKEAETGEIKDKPLTMCPYCWDNSMKLWDCLIDKGTAYCRRCGQAIDWNEV